MATSDFPYAEFTQILCSGVIEIDCEEPQEVADGEEPTPCYGFVLFPCGARFETLAFVSSGEEEFGSQMPFRYQIWRERARLATCCYWRDTESETADKEKLETEKPPALVPEIFSFVNVKLEEDQQFEVEARSEETQQTVVVKDDPNVVGGWAHEDSPSFVLKPRTLETVLIDAASVPTKCTRSDAAEWNQGSDGTPPCNGAKTVCPFYTGKSFNYIRDEQLAAGQKIQVEMIHELRSLMRDWPNLETPQEAWNNAFEEPVMWARDFEDFPLIINQDSEAADVEEFEAVTNLIQVTWNAAFETATQTKVPSQPGGSEVTSPDPEEAITPTAPAFPTTVDNIAISSPPDIKVTFPPPRFLKDSKLSKTPFPFATFNGTQNTMYMSGLSVGLIDVYIVNASIVENFPDLTKQENIDQEAITEIVEELLVKNLTYSDVTGFKVAESDSTRFWDLPDGIDLIPNSVNQIFVLARASSDWSFVSLKVEYLFYHADVVQEGFDTIVPAPISIDLPNRINNVPGGGEFNFTMLSIGNNAPKLKMSYAYNIGSLDRSASRAVEELDFEDRPDQRFWSIFKSDPIEATGDSLDSGEIRWTRLDNCSRYLIEYKPGFSAAAPAGLNRSWEPLSITFKVTTPGDDGAEGFSGIPMKPVEFIGPFGEDGRDLQGRYMPVRFIIVEPEGDDVAVPEPQPTDTMSMEFETYIGDSVSSDADATDELLDKFSEDEFSRRELAGVQVLATVPGMEFRDVNQTAEIKNEGKSLEVTGGTRLGASYMVEFTIDGEDQPIGRKWVAGTAELCHFWVRDVEVQYAWSANQQYTLLEPDYARAFLNLTEGFSYPARMREDPQWLINSKRTTYLPKCRDHEGIATNSGPMFSPYDSCANVPIVRVNDLGIYILFRIPGKKPVDEKLRGPLVNIPKTAYHNVIGTLSKCVFEFSVGTFTRGDSEWGGRARLRRPISSSMNPALSLIYEVAGWRRPQFGNRGRTAIRIYRTVFFEEYVFVTDTGKRKVGQGWLPANPYSSGPTSIYDITKARIAFDNTVEDFGNVSSPADYESFKGQKDLIDLSLEPAEGDDFVKLSPLDINSEVAEFSRLKWRDIYEVRRVRTLDGKGSFWPPAGIYHNFRQPSIVWAWPEAEFDLAREPIPEDEEVDFFSTTQLIGVSYRKPQTAIYPEVIRDKFNRPVFVHIPEGVYGMVLSDVEYDTDKGTIKKYASVSIDKSGFPVYFDRFTGEIKNASSPEAESEGDFEPYYYVAQGDYETLELDFDFSLYPAYAPDPGLGEDEPPEGVDDLDTILNTPANLLWFPEVTYFSLPELEGPLSEEFTWAGVVQGIELTKITPFVMPKQIECVDTTGEFSGKMSPTVNFSVYPSTDPAERKAKSGKDLPANSESIFTCEGDPSPGNDLLWKYLSLEDASLPEEEQTGTFSPFSIVIEFKFPIELYKLEVAYKVEGRDGDPPEVNPAITISAQSSTEGDLLLVQKPSLDLTKGSNASNSNNFEGKFKFSVENEDFKPYTLETLIILVGARNENTSFSFSELFIEHLTLRETGEAFICLEARYLPSTGYAEGLDAEIDPVAAGSQDGSFLTSIVSIKDMGDNVEFAGIAEFWRPGAVSLLQPVGCLGKIRRHYAGDFVTFDVAQFFNDDIDPKGNEVVFNTASAEEAESLQFEYIINAVLEVEPVPKLLDIQMLAFYNPRDLAIIAKTGGKLGFAALDSVAPLWFIDFGDAIFNDEGIVSKSFEPEGWQDVGFEACIVTGGVEILGCISGLTNIIGRKTRHMAY